MLSTAIIVFREMLEAALIVSVMMAASRGAAGRGMSIGGGVAGGVLGACILAIFAGQIAAAMDGVGQEVFNAGVLFAAVLMLAWHSIWMKRHGREMARQMADVANAVRSGGRPIYILGVVVGVAVLREGSETVLFLYGIAAGGSGGVQAMVAGGSLGVIAGLAVGILLYRGLLNIPPRHLFRFTGILILLMAAGMASQAAAFLVAADLLPPLGAEVWDSSAIIDPSGILGRTLHALVGYDARPAGIQLLVFTATLLTIYACMHAVDRPTTRTRPA
ncbi:MAG: FTR1 family protein [Alphaproteobacteria bacterium]|nr:FTR1 family protein [Alphaproteobacteria bacterium]